ncbi:MAG TPA: [Fe-Fe] hydrogenase large subunit C-terminal domain-containing protein [Armatimonadota bacterium]|nr:[Fe-Fe] hydrogenase large subunit C-terminal domain-containing protein [Armatimonadota bacterium]
MSLITVNQVNCKDCYKCVRYCPVKAIRVVNGHAEVADDRCLGDGGCIGVCPQHAKQVRSDVDIVRALLESGHEVIASVAPSAAGVFGDDLPRFIGALHALGFSRVEETARTAEAVAHAHIDLLKQGKPVITTACPAIVSLVEKYYPQYVGYLAPIPSPMLAHARLLREEHGSDIGVVFIGPCVAKKDETTEGLNGTVTFDEIRAWLDEAGISLQNSDEASFDNPPVGTARSFPLLQGLIKTAGLPDSTLTPSVITVSGLREVKTFLEELSSLDGIGIIEALACQGGCLEGPGATIGPALWERRSHLLRNVQSEGVGAAPSNMARSFTTSPLSLPAPTDEEIAAILRRTGKHYPTDEQNCGACGYDTCREKAVAVFQGMAEAEMCVPYMRSRAESFANVVIRSTPNGIVIVDSTLRILDVNPAFAKMFARQPNELIGRQVRNVLDVTVYERVNKTNRPFIRHEVTYDSLIAREMIFPVVDEEIIIGIYVDVTDEVARQQKQLTVKHETLQKTHQVIEKQMRVAQEIAGLLGETTAETKVLLTKLIKLYDEEEGKE